MGRVLLGRLAVSALLCASALSAQITGNNIITTFAGTSWTFPDGAAGKNAPLGPVIQAHLDNSGNLLFADPGNDVVCRINPSGTVSIIAGNGIRGFSGDGGPARSASLNQPLDALMDTAGNLFILDGNNIRIRRVTPDGIISTYAGTGVSGLTGDGGPAISARISSGSTRLALDGAGALYISGAFAIRRISPSGVISTFAGNGNDGRGGENVQATQTTVSPQGGAMAFDAAGNLYLAEAGNLLIRKVTPAGILTTVAGTGAKGNRDGAAASALFQEPRGLAVDAAGAIYVGDNGRIRKISGGTVTTIAGGGTFDSTGDGGPALSATFRFAEGLLFDRAGNLYIAETGSSRFRVISADGNINAVAGNGHFRDSPDGTPARNAYLFLPSDISFDAAGNLLVPDPFTARLRRIKADGTIQLVAGIGTRGSTNMGLATKAAISAIRSAVADAKGNVYWSDTDFTRIMRVTPDGQLSVFVDTTKVKTPLGLTLDGAGNLYVADSTGHQVLKVTPAGAISVFAGTGVKGFSGDGGAATRAQLALPQAVAFDPAGNLIIADSGNGRLRKVTPSGVITTIAGNGQFGPPAPDTPALETGITAPSDLAVDASGNIYMILGVSTNVWQLSAASGTFSSVAGNSKLQGFSGDGGPAKAASINADGLAIDGQGNLYISDQSANRVRVVLATTPSVAVSVGNISFQANSNGAVTDAEVVNVTSSLAGFLYTAKSDQPWLNVPGKAASAPSNIQITADPTGLDAGVYTGTVTIASPGVAAPLASISVTFTVLPPLPPKLGLDTQGITLSATAGDAVQSRSFRVRNAGGGSLDFSITTSGSGSGAIAIDRQSGSVQPTSVIPITVSLDPSALAPGTYQATISVASRTTSQTLNIPVTISVAPRPQRMALSQRGLLFTGVQGGGVTPAQTFAVLNAGQGTFNWKAQGATFPDGSAWLSVSPASGMSDAVSASGQVTVKADPTGIATPGVYYGLVRITADGASNSPQDVEVVLNLLPADNNPGAVVGPSGMVFTAVANGGSPGSQTFSITNLRATDARFALTTLTLDFGSWLQAAPDRGVIPAGGTQIVTVQSDVTGLPGAVYEGQVALQIEDTTSAVKVVLVVAPGSPGTSDFGRAAAGCAPTTVIPVFTSFLQDFTVPAAWPIPLEVRAVDDCGTPQTAGRVFTTFSNGDPPLTLVSLKDGRWQGTWYGGNIRVAKIAVTANAEQDTPQIRGSLTYTGTLQANSDIPAVTPGAVTNAAPSLPEAPLAPGSLISIAGKSFAAGQLSAGPLPLSANMSGTQVILAGRSLPLIYTSGGLINAVVPYDIVPDGQYSLLVARGGAVSGPETVAVAAAQPSVIKIDASGNPQVIQDFWTQILSGAAIDPASAAPAAPAHARDKLTLYCTGLGAVDAAIDAATAAPSTPPNVKNPVTVTIGNAKATVSSATLVPGYTGLYQVQITVPDGLAAGDGIPVVVSVLGQASVPVNLSVR